MKSFSRSRFVGAISLLAVSACSDATEESVDSSGSGGQGVGGVQTSGSGGQGVQTPGAGGEVAVATGGDTAVVTGSGGDGPSSGGAIGTGGVTDVPETVCGQASEGDTLLLSCPTGQVIESVVFASYGTPEGACGSLSSGSCDATSSLGVLEAECLGQSSCSVSADNDVFGDPCSGVVKELAAEVSCAGSTGAGGSPGSGGDSGTGGALGTGGDLGTGGSPPIDDGLIGWASVDACGPNGTTGGGNGPPTVTVTSGSELEDALTQGGPLVIAVSGSMSSPGRISGVHDKTLIGENGAEISGDFGLSGSSNVIIKNIEFSGGGGGDTFELSGCECVWFDHCTFRDGGDGNLDIVRASDLVTVSWSHFYYTEHHGHMLSNLCGNSNDRSSDEGKINITFHHNFWGAGVRSRAPRVRYGKVHVFNNYYKYEQVEGQGSSNYAVGAGQHSNILVENNWFEDIGDVITYMSDGGTAIVNHSGNEMVNSGGTESRGTAFTPPYPYTLESPAEARTAVMSSAGAQ